MLFIALCVTVAVLCWALTAVLVALLWPVVRPSLSKLPSALAADSLFLLEIFPLISSAVVVSLFVIPGFVAWEPAQTDENVSPWLLGASVFALGLALGAAWRLYLEVRRRPVIAADKPFIAVLGCLRQKIVVTDAVHTLLTQDELQAVLRHETAHIERRDNFRLLLARTMSMLTLNPRSWSEMEAVRARMTEFAADSIAVTDERSALDLAQALVKVARDFPAAQYRFASSLLPRRDSIQERVLRLLNQSGEPVASVRYLAVISGILFALLVTAALQHDLQYFCYRGLERLVSF